MGLVQLFVLAPLCILAAAFVGWVMFLWALVAIASGAIALKLGEK